MRRKYFLLEPALVNHDFEVNVDVLPTCQVVCLLLLLLLLHVLHLDASLLPLLLNALNFVQRIALLVLVASLHQ